ncbi:hypothetical protein Syun_011986 [Stephania yunnanensis]|uniref:Uncharacterized protein n=1 Tax=Stephania yunnanensis TaxID=152371 RepID=A0AAP0PJ11_9MAGN
MAGIDMDVLPEKIITDEVIERDRKVDGYENSEDKRKKAGMERREIERRRKIIDDTRRVIEKVKVGFYGYNSAQLNANSKESRTGVREPDGLSEEHSWDGKNDI